MRAALPALILLISFLSASTVSAQVATRLTAASNVRLRAEAAESATVVASLPLGTELVQLDTGGADHTWVRVRPSTGPDGWLPVRLTRRIKAETRLDVIESLVRERLARSGDSFAARVELVALVERTIADLRRATRTGRPVCAAPGSVRWTARLRPFPDRKAAPSRMPPGSAIVARDLHAPSREDAGRFSRAAILDLHHRHRDTSAADDIAWFLVEHGTRAARRMRRLRALLSPPAGQTRRHLPASAPCRPNMWARPQDGLPTTR